MLVTQPEQQTVNGTVSLLIGDRERKKKQEDQTYVGMRLPKNSKFKLDREQNKENWRNMMKAYVQFWCTRAPQQKNNMKI